MNKFLVPDQCHQYDFWSNAPHKISQSLRCTTWLVSLLHSIVSSVHNNISPISPFAYQIGVGELVPLSAIFLNYRLTTAYLLLRVNLDKIMHACWDFDASSARTRRVSALDKHQNWSASALFCLNSRAQNKYAVVNLIHTQRKQTFLSFIMW